MCGVVSVIAEEAFCKIKDSPHVRGCIYRSRANRCRAIGFPACAGLYRDDVYSCLDLTGIPRMCGVVSILIYTIDIHHEDSPHVRGCI